MKRLLLVLAAVLTAGLTVNAPPARGQAWIVAHQSPDSLAQWDSRAADLALPVDSLVARLADRRALIRTDGQWRLGRLQNDALLLDSLLLDEWTVTVSGSPGTVIENAAETKAQYLADVRSGTRSYESIVEDATTVRIYGDTAVVTGRTTSKGYLNDRLTSDTSQFIRMYAKRLGRWQMVAATSTAILP